jgi:hypothetical protein
VNFDGNAEKGTGKRRGRRRRKRWRFVAPRPDLRPVKILHRLREIKSVRTRAVIQTVNYSNI